MITLLAMRALATRAVERLYYSVALAAAVSFGPQAYANAEVIAYNLFH